MTLRKISQKKKIINFFFADSDSTHHETDFKQKKFSLYKFFFLTQKNLNFFFADSDSIHHEMDFKQKKKSNKFSLYKQVFLTDFKQKKIPNFFPFIKKNF